MSEEDKRRVRSLVENFQAFWEDPQTSFRDRKRMLRLLVEDVTLEHAKTIQVHLRFRGGATETLSVQAPKNAWQLRQTPREIVERIDHLLEDHDEWEIAEILDGENLTTASGHRFTSDIVRDIRRKYRLVPRRQRLRERGFLAATQIAQRFHVGRDKVMSWRRAGLLTAHRYSHRWWLYEDPTPIAGELPGLPDHVRSQLSL